MTQTPQKLTECFPLGWKRTCSRKIPWYLDNFSKTHQIWYSVYVPYHWNHICFCHHRVWVLGMMDELHHWENLLPHLQHVQRLVQLNLNQVMLQKKMVKVKSLSFNMNTHLQWQRFGFETLIESSACITMNQIIVWIKLHIMMALKEQSKKSIQTKQVKNIRYLT